MLGGPDGPKRTIVGIVGNVRQGGLDEAVSLQAYLPLEQFYDAPVRVVLRSADDPSIAAARIRAAVRLIDPAQAVSGIQPFTAVVAKTNAERRFLLGLVGAFATASVVLAVIGLYGIVSYVVAQRRRDIGLRVALGATAFDIRKLVLRVGLAPVVVGLAAGLLLTALATRPLEGMLFSVQRLDPPTLAGAAAVLFASAVVACYLPARRAARLDPVAALRAD